MTVEGPDPRSNVVYLPQAYQAHWAEEDLAERDRVTSRGRFAEFACNARQRFRVATLGQAGMATAEYAIATLAAVGFAALLIAILKSNEVRGFLMAIIQNALSF